MTFVNIIDFFSYRLKAYNIKFTFLIISKYVIQ